MTVPIFADFEISSFGVLRDLADANADERLSIFRDAAVKPKNRRGGEGPEGAHFALPKDGADLGRTLAISSSRKQ